MSARVRGAATISALAPLLTRDEVCDWLHISRATSYRQESAGYLPRGLRLAPGIVRWRREDIEQLLRRAAEDRGTNPEAA